MTQPRKLTGFVLLLACLAGAASAQTTAVDTVSGWHLDHKYTGSIKGSVSNVAMSNRYSATVRLGGGLTSTTNLSVREVHYRLQDRRDNTKNFSSNLLATLRPGLNLTATFSDNRFFNRVVTFSNELQDLKNDATKVEGTLSYVKIIPAGVTLSGETNVGFTESDQSFLTEGSLEGAVKGEARYAWKNHVTVTTRGYLRSSDDTADTGVIKVQGLGVDEDSVSSMVVVSLPSGTRIEGSYRRSSYTNDFMDLPRGVFLEQQFSEDLRKEREKRDGNALMVKATVKPLPGVKLEMESEHAENTTDFAVETKRSSKTVTDRVQAKLAYTLGKATNFDVSLENREVLNDRPASLGGYRDERNSLKLSLNHPFSNTFSFTLQTGTSILQTFYLNFDLNPRDRDQLDQYVNLRINSAPFAKTTAQVYLSINKTEYVAIDRSLSQNNRSETTYDFRPQFTYRLTDWIEITQMYGLNIEFTEFDFTADDNFLDRNFTFSNKVVTKLTKRLTTEMNYQLRLHDRGSYVAPAPGQERLLDIETEDRRDQMTLSFRYKINGHLTLLGMNDYSQRVDEIGGRDVRTTDGGLELGLEGKYKLGKDRSLDFKLLKVNRFGRFNSAAQEDYWVMDSQFVYTF